MGTYAKIESKEGNLSYFERGARILLGILLMNIVIYSSIAGSALFTLIMGFSIAWAVCGIIGYDPCKALCCEPKFHESAVYKRYIRAYPETTLTTG